MSTTEIILNILAETAAKNISQTENPSNFEENKSAAQRGRRIAGNARKELEAEIGHSVISNKAAPELNTIVTNLIENAGNEEKDDQCNKTSSRKESLHSNKTCRGTGDFPPGFDKI